MRSAILVLLVACALAGCGRSEDRTGTSGEGKIYGRGGENQERRAPAEIRAGASSTATDLRPTGGSMAGAGGAGPGYDGSGKGGGEHGTIPPPGAGFAGSLTNAQSSTNSQPSTSSNTQPQAVQNNASPKPTNSPPPSEPQAR